MAKKEKKESSLLNSKAINNLIDNVITNGLSDVYSNT
jgi:hypothetical protein